MALRNSDATSDFDPFSLSHDDFSSALDGMVRMFNLAGLGSDEYTKAVQLAILCWETA